LLNEQYFPLVLFITVYKVVLTFDSLDENLSVTIQMKATEQYFLVALFMVILAFESGRNNVKRVPTQVKATDQYSGYGFVSCAVQCGSN